MVKTKPARFIVNYRDGGKRNAFACDHFADALWWAVFLRLRWDLAAWIDREGVPARLPEA